MFQDKMFKQAVQPFMRRYVKNSMSAWRYDSSVTDLKNENNTV